MLDRMTGWMLWLLVLWLLLLLSMLTTAIVPLLYMDEVFHVPQAQAYCDQRFHVWDGNITTFPGVYLTAFVLHSVLPAFPCDVAGLRIQNALYGAVTALLLPVLLRQMHPHMSQAQLRIRSATILLTPTLVLYFVLFYTDAGALFWLLATLTAANCAVSSQHPNLLASLTAAFAGTMAVLYRQTNGIWVAFTIGLCVLRALKHLPVGEFPVAPSGQHAQTVSWASGDGHGGAEPRLRKVLTVQMDDASSVISAVWQSRGALLLRLGGLALVLVALAAFVFHRGSLVLGDAEHHKPVLHLAQLFYWLVFQSASFLPSPRRLRSACSRCFAILSTKQALTALLAASVLAVVLPSFTFAHPYLLADNRHYAFYLWRRVFSRPIPSALLCVLYIVIPCRLHQQLGVAVGQAGAWLFWVATALTLVPSPLFEPRYQIIPTVVLSVFLPPKEGTMATQEAYVWLCVNAGVCASLFGVFLLCPWTWHDGTVARLIW